MKNGILMIFGTIWPKKLISEEISMTDCEEKNRQNLASKVSKEAQLMGLRSFKATSVLCSTLDSCY